MTETIETDVAIVGCGPVGALTANLLGLRGVRVLVLERDTAEHGQPRAFSCDDEALRVYQAAGLVDEVREHMVEAGRVHYTGVGGRKFAELSLEGLDFGSGYPVLSFFYQPRLEAALRAGTARFPHVELRLGHEVAALAQDTEGVTLEVRDHANGRALRVRARYVLGCDGARSAVRRLAGIGMRGMSYEEPWLAVSGEVEEDALRLPDTRFVCDPERPAFVGKGALHDYRVELMLLPGETQEEMEHPDTVRRLISPYVDPDRYRITRSVVYRFHNAVAERWRAGRVFLVGDAAHQMPPMMGQGLVSGLRDALNLAWKLDLALRGVSGPDLLDSYEGERRPHVKAMADASVGMGRVFMSRSRLAAGLRDRFFRAVQLVPRVRRFISGLEFKPLPVYGSGVMLGGRRRGRGAPEGTLFPQGRVETERRERLLSDRVLGGGFAVVALGADPRAVAPAADRGLWEALGTTLVKVIPAGAPWTTHPPEVRVVRDLTGRFTEWFRKHGAQVAVVRPDRFVFGAVRAEDAPVLAGAVRQALGTGAAGGLKPRPAMEEAAPAGV